MPTTIADLWLLTYEDDFVDIRSPLFKSQQIEHEVRRANREYRKDRTDWTAIDLEEVILFYATSHDNNLCSPVQMHQEKILR